MNSRFPMLIPVPMRPRFLRGFSLIELMISITLSLIVLSALVGLFVNTSRNSGEMAKTNAVIENGRFSLQLLENDLVHAGYLAGYPTQFDDIHYLSIPPKPAAPTDAPTLIPNPCQAYAAWTPDYITALVGIAVQSAADLPAGCGFGLVRRLGTDVLIVRHVETCRPDTTNCDASTAGRAYFQTSYCLNHQNVSVVATGTSANSVRFTGSTISTADSAYVGTMIRIVSGAGAGQIRRVTAYFGTAKRAIVTPDWTTVPDTSSRVAFDYNLSTGPFRLPQRDCATINPPRHFVSHIYYVTNIDHPDRAGETIPALVRSRLEVVGGVPAHTEPVVLIEGVENFRVELGIDDSMTRCGRNDAVDNTAIRNVIQPEPTCAIDLVDPNNNTLATNRGDGMPDRYRRCANPATPCSVADLTNVVAAKIYVLVRAREPTPGYQDTKLYCLGEPDLAGNCLAANRPTVANDAYKRHVFSTTVRFNNISARRESP